MIFLLTTDKNFQETNMLNRGAKRFIASLINLRESAIREACILRDLNFLINIAKEIQHPTESETKIELPNNCLSIFYSVIAIKYHRLAFSEKENHYLALAAQASFTENKSPESTAMTPKDKLAVLTTTNAFQIYSEAASKLMSNHTPEEKMIALSVLRLMIQKIKNDPTLTPEQKSACNTVKFQHNPYNPGFSVTFFVVSPTEMNAAS